MPPARYPETMTREQRRARGTFYTPPSIVARVVKRTLGPLMTGSRRQAADGRLDEALELAVLDPAVGDGVFLQAAGRLIAGELAAASGREPGEILPLVTGRCLHGIDIDPEAVKRARRGLGRPGRGRLIVADALSSEPPRPAGRAGFHAVIGNPPWGGWNRRLDEASRRRYRARFETARGLLDPCVLFIERITGWLEPGGRLGLVLPDYLLLKNYPAARKYLLDHYHLEEMIHWGRAFPAVNLDVFSLVARRAARHSPAGRVVCLPRGPGGHSLRVPVTRFRKAPGFGFNICLGERAASLLDRLERTAVPLSRLLETHEGIHSGNVRPKLFLAPDGPPPRGAPPSRIRPLLMGGSEMRPFHLAPAGWRVVYDPGIVDRAAGEYANLGRRRWFSSRKILVRRTGDQVLAALDTKGFFASNNFFVALSRPGGPASLEFLEAYLNSSLATWCFRAIQPRAGRLFAELKLVHLNRLPVPIPDRAQERRIRALGARVRRSAAAGVSDREARRRLDEAFARLARLSAEEALMVESRFPTSPDYL